MANEVAPGVWEYVGGQSYRVEMTNNGAVLEAIFPVAQSMSLSQRRHGSESG